MKRSKLNVIFSLLFGLCLIFAIFSISYLGVNVNAVESENVEGQETTPPTEETVPPVEEKQVFTYEDEDGKIELTILNEEEINVKIIPLVGETREGVFKYKYYETKKQNYYEILANKEGESNIYFEVNLENNTFTPIEKPKESHPIRDIKDKIESWVTAFIVALLGNLSFFGLARALLSKGNKLLIKKINELEAQNRVTTEQKDAMVDKVNSLQDKVDALAGLNQKLIDVIYEKMDVDQAKVDKTNELLDKVFPKQNGVDLDEIKK